MEVTKRPFPRVGITHIGVFHADDVFAAAFLRCIDPKIEIKRQRIASPEFARYPDDTIIFDVGGGEFDHHTKETQEWRDPENQRYPYASFGKIVRAFWPYLFDDERVMKAFDAMLVVGIDSHDCGTFGTVPNTLAMAISAFNPNWNENLSANEAFEDAVAMAKVVIKNFIRKAKAMVESEDKVAAALNQRKPGERFIVLDHYVNYNAYLKNAPVDWVIYPSLRGGFQLYSVMRNGVNADLLPEDYLSELRSRTDTLFVHPAGFTATFTSLVAAIRAARERSDAVSNTSANCDDKTN